MNLNCLCIDSDEDLANGGYSGIITEKTVGENVAFKDVLYLKNDGKLWKADGDTEATMKSLCVMAVETILADAKGKVMTIGFFRDDTDDWTVSGKFFISTTAGELTQTPLAAGKWERCVGYGTHANRGFFNPDSSYVEVPS